jgi:SSS family solute:Na+ symporter
LTHGLTGAEGKGAWLANLHEFPTIMAQNFWVAIFAWSACFMITVLVSYGTKPRPAAELVGLVYGLTKVPHEERVSWYEKPGPLALAVGIILLLLNIWFW